jgi:hypothetical protein
VSRRATERIAFPRFADMVRVVPQLAPPRGSFGVPHRQPFVRDEHLARRLFHTLSAANPFDTSSTTR